MTNIFAPLCIEYGATKYVGKTIFRFSGFANENRIDSENNKKFLKATLCHQIYKEISGCPEDDDQGDPVLLRARLSTFTRGKKSKHTLSPKELVSLATNEPIALFLSELNRIEELIDVTAYINCVGISQVDENLTLEAQLGSCPEEQLLLYKEQVKNKLADQYNRNIKQFECPDFFKLEATNRNITLILTCLILHAVFNNESCLEQLDSNGKEKIQKNIEMFYKTQITKENPTHNICYFETLWQKYYLHKIRDYIPLDKAKEYVDVYVTPTFTDRNNKSISTPFKKKQFKKIITADSGIGKSALLHNIILTNIIAPLYHVNSSVLSENSCQKYEYGNYEAIRYVLFGENTTSYFPVYIEARKANSAEIKELNGIQFLAEESDLDNFNQLLSEANQAGNLLFLIDAIDEIEQNKFGDFLEKITELEGQFKRASIIITSRFTGVKHIPQSFEKINLIFDFSSTKEFIEKLSIDNPNELINLLENNPHLREISQNPDIIQILTKPEHRTLATCLTERVKQVIHLRQRGKESDISTKDMKKLLGFLACKFVFGQFDKATKEEVCKIFLDAHVEGLSSMTIEEYAKKLSSQSGILNIVIENSGDEYFVFQDKWVMCVLATNYLINYFYSKSINFEESLENENVKLIRGFRDKEYQSNAFYIHRFIDGFFKWNGFLSKEAIKTLILTCVVKEDQDDLEILPTSILYYLIFKHTTSTNKDEILNIVEGYDFLLENAFGENDIANNNNGESKVYKMISRIHDV